ncbi:putative permease [Luteibacter jiangsuensis]|uniref:Permease n=1 Tax=Luteibacter jiangsuensis TaxID=637577 RepID=A0ABT9SXQ9_9GAMM|nr:ABC transporter permease [Luteibacter jiangsuensis]MDQ0009171.1 putative permease [Luteibacter jiangsuensis]
MSRITDIVRFWRASPRQPGSLLLASATLAIGVAALAGAFTLMEAVLLRPPPWPNHANVAVYGGRTADDPMRAASPSLYDMVGSPESVRSRGAARMPEAMNVVYGRHRGLLRTQRVDVGFLPTLGIVPALGERVPSRMGGAEVMVSNALWHRWFDADAMAVGRVLLVDGQPMRISGVLPADYRFFADVDLILPLVLPSNTTDRVENMTAVALLAPGSITAFSESVMDTVGRNAARLHLEPADTRWYGATPLDTLTAPGARATIWLCVGCALLVLIVAAMNVSNLMLTRALDRTQETSLLFALGATGWRPWIPALSAAVVTALLAAVIGMPVGALLVMAFRPLVPDSWLASAGPLAPGSGVLVAVLVSVLLAALLATGSAVAHQHFATTGYPAPAFAPRRVYSAMALVQTALATLLLCVSTAAALRWWRLDQLPLGFDHANALVMEVRAPPAWYAGREATERLATSLRAKALRLPGVETMGWSTQLPVGDGFVMPFLRPGGAVVRLQYAVVTPGALESLGLEKTRGRWLEDGDRGDSERVVVVNQAYLEQVDGYGVGGMVRPASGRHAARIVGVVANTPLAGVSAEAEPAVFVPLAQIDHLSFATVRQWTSMYAVLRGPSVGPATGDAFARIVQDMAPSLAPANARALDQVAQMAYAEPRRDAVLLSSFAGFALALACVGHYSVQAVEVISRRRMFALRGALGATPAALMAQVLRRALVWALPGVAAGLLAALAAHRWLFVTDTALGMSDPWVFATVVPMMTVATIAAVLLPAWRAAAVEPWRVLRSD